jgi:hypothetical protein
VIATVRKYLIANLKCKKSPALRGFFSAKEDGLSPDGTNSLSDSELCPNEYTSSFFTDKPPMSPDSDRDGGLVKGVDSAKRIKKRSTLDLALDKAGATATFGWR